jgi:hypothetical protein
MNKEDKDWARAKIFQIIDTPTAELLVDDPRDKLVSNHVRKTPNLNHSKVGLKRERYSHEEQQMQLFAKYLADELKKRGYDQK